MTKKLTEQWREGTLPEGWYYVKTHCEEIKKLYCGDGESLELDDPETSAYYFYHRENGKGQVEILAPVPSYDEYKELKTKYHQLEKELVLNKLEPIHLNNCLARISELEEKNKNAREKVKKLQEQLKEAQHTIYCIANTDGSDCKTILETIIRDANLYLEKWGVK